MKYWMWIPALFALVFVGDRLGGAALAHLTKVSHFRYSRLYTDRAAAEVVFIGNSRGLTFYQPKFEILTGKSTLNLSYNAMPPDIAAALLTDYLARYPAPEHLFVDITMIDRDNGSLALDFQLYAPYSERLDSLVYAAQPSIYYGNRLAHLTRYGGEVAQRMLYYLHKSDKDWLLDRVISEQMVVDTSTLARGRMDYVAARNKPLLASIAAFREAGTTVHLVINPYFPPFARSVSNLDSVATAFSAAAGLPVRNYAIAIPDPALFGDYQHLNKAGAERFLQTLAQDAGLGKD